MCLLTHVLKATTSRVNSISVSVLSKDCAVLQAVSFSTPFPPADWNQCSCNLSDSTLRRKQIELRCGISGVLYVESNAQIVQIFAHCGCNGRSMWASPDDEKVYLISFS